MSTVYYGPTANVPYSDESSTFVRSAHYNIEELTKALSDTLLGGAPVTIHNPANLNIKSINIEGIEYWNKFEARKLFAKYLHGDVGTLFRRRS